MSQEFFNGLKQGFELGGRFKYLQVNLLALMRDFEKLNQKSKTNYLYELWTKVMECQSNIEEIPYEEEVIDEATRHERLNNLSTQLNEYRQKYRVLLENYNEIKKKPATRKRKVVVVEEAASVTPEDDF